MKKKKFCCPALELFHCLPLWKTVRLHGKELQNVTSNNVFYHSIITGYQQIDYNYDPEYLFSPTDGEAKQERANLEHYFPTNFSDFKASRITRPGKFGRVIIAAKDGKSMLRTHLWDQLLYLDQVRIIF